MQTLDSYSLCIKKRFIKSSMAEEFRVLRPREYHSQLVLKGTRIDGRRLDEARDIKLETNAIRTADSSALVKLGNTSLICGCIARLEPLTISNEHEDNIKIKVELPPICSGPTGQKMQQATTTLGRTLKNILNDSECLEIDGLHLDEKAWKLDIEVICLNYDGSLLDASLIGLLAAIRSLKSLDKANEKPYPTIRLRAFPVALSFATIGEKMISDPNLEEETVATSTLSITVDSTTDKCCHINKIGGQPISHETLMECIQQAKHRAFKLRKSLTSISEAIVTQMECS